VVYRSVNLNSKYIMEYCAVSGLTKKTDIKRCQVQNVAGCWGLSRDTPRDTVVKKPNTIKGMKSNRQGGEKGGVG
jgi:hypothetical protein